MRREFVPFEEERIRKELEALPDKDRAKLASLMVHYERIGTSNPAPAQVDDYGNGIYRLRHMKPAYQGRLIYFLAERTGMSERLIMLMVYKKEGQKMPLSLLETALRRKQKWEQSQKGR